MGRGTKGGRGGGRESWSCLVTSCEFCGRECSASYQDKNRRPTFTVVCKRVRTAKFVCMQMLYECLTRVSSGFSSRVPSTQELGHSAFPDPEQTPGHPTRLHTPADACTRLCTALALTLALPLPLESYATVVCVQHSCVCFLFRYTVAHKRFPGSRTCSRSSHTAHSKRYTATRTNLRANVCAGLD